MFGVTPIEHSEKAGVLTVRTRENQVFEFVKPARMDSLPDDLIKAIFTRLITKMDFLEFSIICKRMFTISCDIPVYAFTSEPLCRLIFMRNKDIKGASVKFIDAVVKESDKSFVFVNEKLRLCQPSIELQEAQGTFYTIFTNCCFQQNTNIDCKKFFDYLHISSRCVNGNYRKDYSREKLNQIKLRMGCVFFSLRDVVYKDIVNICVNQINVPVTFHSFKSSVAQIQKLFGPKNEIDLEADLRNALRTKHAFEAFASQYLDVSLSSTIVTEMQLQLRAPLLAEKAAIEAELAILGGSNGSNGTVNDAHMEMNMEDEPVDEALANAALVALNEAVRKVGYSTFHPIYAQMYPEVGTAYAEFERANENPSVHKREAAEAKFDTLIARLNTLAQWEKDTGTLIGGRLFEVCKMLKNIGSIAWFKVRKRGEFYAEMACPITAENKRERFDALLKFSDS